MVSHTQPNSALPDIEELFERLFDHLPIGVFVVQNRRFRMFNPHLVQRLLGFSQSEILAMDCLDPVFPEDRNAVREAAVMQLKGKRSAPYECRLVRKDGTVGWVVTVVMPWQYRGERATLGYSMDITERKQIEEAYRKSQERFSGICSSSKDGIVFLALDGTLLDVNDALRNLTGFTKEDLLTRNYRDLTAREYCVLEARIMETVLHTGKPAEYEKECIRKDGSRVPVSSTSFIVRDSDSKPMGLAAILRDLTAQKETEKAARESERRYQAIFDNSSDAIIIRDFDGNIAEVNRATASLTGYAHDELVKMNIAQLLSPESFKLTMKSQEALLKGEPTGRRHELQLTRRDGSRRHVESVVGLVTESGHPVGIQAMVRDVTEQKRLRENMQFYISEITRAQEEERKRIASDLHDETAQALASLSLDIDIASRGNGQLSDEVLQLLQQFRARVDDISDDVRRFSHRLRPPILDYLGLTPSLGLLIDDLKTDSKVAARTETIGSPRRLPSEVELGLFRIAQEALRNVVKHSQAREVVVRIEFASTAVRLSVTDNGKGFETPGSLGDLASKGKLGLLGMQERARLLGGNLNIKSQVGSGTAIEVEIAG